jgi:hypothetical protein
VSRCLDKWKANAAKAKAKKKKRLKELQSWVADIKQRMKAKCFKLTSLKVTKLKDYCKWKKKEGVDPLPTKTSGIVHLSIFSCTRFSISHSFPITGQPMQFSSKQH